MLTLVHPWLLALLPLPLLVRRLAPPHRQSRAALQAPFVDRLAAITGREPLPGATVTASAPAQLASAAAIWVLLVIALARPAWLEDPVTRVQPGRDLLLAVDISGSMEVDDFTDAAGARTSRMDAVKQVLDGFLAARQGDRVGLVLFGSAAFVQAPFTQDLEVVRVLLDEVRPRMAGPRTALGDAIGLAMTLFDRSDLEQRVLILLTDGNDTGSLVPPARAAELASERGVVVHVIGVGDPMAAEEEALDEALLRRIAETTGGRYHFAADRAALGEVARAVDALTPSAAQVLSHHPRRDLFHWPLGLALALSLTVPLLRAIGSRRSAPSSSGQAEAAAP